LSSKRSPRAGNARGDRADGCHALCGRQGEESGMATELQRIAETSMPTPEEIKSKTEEIYRRVLAESKYVDGGNFTTIHTTDLAKLFSLYDSFFLDDQCRASLADVPLVFRLSRRMTKAAGKTGRRELRHPSGRVLRSEYELSISTTLLFQTFQDEQRPIRVTGIVCRDRLEALQRVFEHEIVHLLEMLVWTASSCRADRFQAIAARLFGHTEHTHQLITPHERAFTKFGIKPGDRVKFRFDGRHFVGLVNRITRRATVLVEDREGPLYSDGKRYAKFYVPLNLLNRVE
jgi:hypothetical protein